MCREDLTFFAWELRLLSNVDRTPDMTYPHERARDDIGVPGPSEVSRYILACDYLENNEYRSVAREALAFLESNDGSIVLDIGCGPGTLCERLRSGREAIKVVGIDASPQMINHARGSYPNCDFLFGFAEQLPVASETVDMVVCLNTLHHLTDIAAALREIVRVLRPGGIAILRDLRRDASGSDVEQKLKRMHPAVAEDLVRSIRSAFRGEEIVQELHLFGIQEVKMRCGRPFSDEGLFLDPYEHEADWPLYFDVRFRKAYLQ
jgi:ubiquinone/menaquinone biosynthesis C-methylase UbiE